MENWYQKVLFKKAESYIGFKLISPRQYGPYTYLKGDITVDDEFEVNEYHVYTFIEYYDEKSTSPKCLGIFKSGPPDRTRL